MNFLAVIDPLDRLNPQKDTSLALLAAGHGLGHQGWITTQAQMSVNDGQPLCQASRLDWSENSAKITTSEQRALETFDLILMRKDPPFDMNYIYTTYLLSLAEAQGVLVANRPNALRDINEKYVTTHFAEHCPPTLISQDRDQLYQFWQHHGDVIFKPLNGMGGQGIFRIGHDPYNLDAIIHQLTADHQTPIIAQPYLPAIETQGDRRILVLGDRVVDQVLARYPGERGRGNLAQGASGRVEPITAHQHAMAEHIRDVLLPQGISLIGIDVIGRYVTEINVTSPTCLVEIQQHMQQPLAINYLKYLLTKSKSAKGASSTTD